ncbi:MAG: peptidoglycan editing factor PgeF [Acetobacteraceae bacterium]
MRLPHGFFTRQGGVSEGPFASLNCSVFSADRPEAVQENRARAARAIGAKPELLVGLRQVHGRAVQNVTKPWPPGREPTADAIVTNQPGLALGIVTADCAPVLLADIRAGVIGAAHAGWRGALIGVLEATIGAMQALGAVPERVRAVIGPAIRQASYEVGPDLREAVLAAAGGDTRFFAPAQSGHRWQFDLPAYCQARLANAGIGAVESINADTATEPERFFSHRRRTRASGGPIGHQISLIMLRAP